MFMLTTTTQTNLNPETIALIEEDVRHLLDVMSFSGSRVSCASKLTKDKAGLPRQQIHINIEAKQSGRLLIGLKGAHLNALSYILRSIMRRQLRQPVYVTVDVNGYLASHELSLQSLAEESAQKAGRTGRAVVLPPMNAADRHVVHTALSVRPDVTTASLGDEPNRRVVVRPVFI